MKLQRVHVHFNGECPRLGSGWRIVEAEVGRKWARLRCHGRTAKLRKAVWLEIAQSATELPSRRRRSR